LMIKMERGAAGMGGAGRRRNHSPSASAMIVMSRVRIVMSRRVWRCESCAIVVGERERERALGRNLPVNRRHAASLADAPP
jgi:hypothetical protein